MWFKKKVPHSDDGEDRLRILNPDTPFAIIEAFKTLNTNILYLPIEDKCKKICVTSSVAGEGKTYVSVNLAISLADNNDGAKVLLIDLDMRNPRAKRLTKLLYEKTNEVDGASEFLAGISKEPNFVKSKIENLYFMFSGANSVNPLGLIGSSRMKKLMEIASNEFDYIIIDTPPVGVVTDALRLSSCVNGYIVVARADYSDINSLNEAIESIAKVDGKTFGVVLSSVKLKAKTGAYSYTYSYQNSDKQP
jgi:capsular exopolysaccharide synthesis family protein